MFFIFKEINLLIIICKDEVEWNKSNKIKIIRGDGFRINFVGIN